jgi:hypothetical protein
MTSSTFVESLALFGSVPRGDTDRLSDKDILVAGCERSLVVGQVLSRAGYSPSVYSWQQLETLANDGSLFIQHLKQESSVLLDRNGRLGSLFNSYRPLKDYSHRIAQNLELFEMTRGMPNSAALVGWALDVLAVGIRNHAILQLANRGRYVFSYAALVAEMCELHSLSAADSKLLIDLRRRKREYRSQCVTPDDSFEALTRTQELIERVTGVCCVTSPLSLESFVNLQMACLSDAVHWYYPLRRLEGVYRAIMGFTPTVGLPPLHREIELVFASPSPYCGSDSGSIEWIRNNIEAIAKAWAAQRHLRS